MGMSFGLVLLATTACVIPSVKQSRLFCDVRKILITTQKSYSCFGPFEKQPVVDEAFVLGPRLSYDALHLPLYCPDSNNGMPVAAYVLRLAKVVSRWINNFTARVNAADRVKDMLPAQRCKITALHSHLEVL